jgi:hypothetical protein
MSTSIMQIYSHRLMHLKIFPAQSNFSAGSLICYARLASPPSLKK